MFSPIVNANFNWTCIYSIYTHPILYIYKIYNTLKEICLLLYLSTPHSLFWTQQSEWSCYNKTLNHVSALLKSFAISFSVKPQSFTTAYKAAPALWPLLFLLSPFSFTLQSYWPPCCFLRSTLPPGAFVLAVQSAWNALPTDVHVTNFFSSIFVENVTFSIRSTWIMLFQIATHHCSSNLNQFYSPLLFSQNLPSNTLYNLGIKYLYCVLSFSPCWNISLIIEGQ